MYVMYVMSGLKGEPAAAAWQRAANSAPPHGVFRSAAVVSPIAPHHYRLLLVPLLSGAMASLSCAPAASRFTPAGAQQQRPSRRCVIVRAETQSGSEPGGSSSGSGEGRPAVPPPAAASTSGSSLPSLADPAGVVVYGGRLPPTRRLLISGLSATAVGEPKGA